jgi:hypothetical protein
MKNLEIDVASLLCATGTSFNILVLGGVYYQYNFVSFLVNFLLRVERDLECFRSLALKLAIGLVRHVRGARNNFSL